MSPRRRVGVLAAGIAAVGGLVLLVGCRGGSSDARGEHIIGGGVTTIDADYRKPVPDVSGELLDGGRFDLGDYRGKVVVLNFWGSWCGPCNREAPMLRTLSQELAADGVSFVGIDLRDQKASALRFLDRYSITYPNVFDPPGQTLVAFAPKVPGNPPNTIVLDRQGRVAVRITGETSASTLRPLIEDVAGESAS